MNKYAVWSLSCEGRGGPLIQLNRAKGHKRYHSHKRAQGDTGGRGTRALETVEKTAGFLTSFKFDCCGLKLSCGHHGLKGQFCNSGLRKSLEAKHSSSDETHDEHLLGALL